MITFVIGLLLSGLILGALGRLLVPGPNPMGIFATICCGWAGSFLGGLVGKYVLGWRFRYSFILAVAATALIVYLVSRRSAPGARTRSRL
ncbi:MAG: GlsB/YeaQ/YmgE family stress response membrane protein [Acidimicrobiales bacterium]